MDVEALQGGKESNPVDLLSKSRPNKKPKPKKEARPSEKKSSPSPYIPGTVLDVVEIVTLIVTLVRRYVLSPPCLSMYESLNSC